MSAFLLIPLSIAAGMAGGALIARRAIRGEMDELRALIGERNAPVAAPQPAPVEAASAPAIPEAGGISPEILMVLTAAVAAFLGKKARIRRASPMPSMNSWAQQGRVFVQASHNLPLHHR